MSSTFLNVTFAGLTLLALSGCNDPAKDKTKAVDQDVFTVSKLLFDETVEPYGGTSAGAGRLRPIESGASNPRMVPPRGRTMPFLRSVPVDLAHSLRFHSSS